ncbi:MAG TPA: tetratricopeptide repeat protein [Gemmatimonadaceae bacterium]|nr:tetratricopeptide repeat protein [Gemmatimonadaceae bacterium]
MIASEREQLDEGLRLQKAGLLEEALQLYDAASRSADGTIRALALCRKADLYRVWSRWEQATDSAREGAAVARKAGEYTLYAEAINAEANVYHQRGEFDAAIPLYERVLELPVDDRVRGLALQNMGSIAAQREDLDNAERLFLDSYWHFRRAGYDWGVAFVLNNQAAAALDRGRYASAATIARQAMEAARQVDDFELLGVSTLNYAEALAAQDDLAHAESLAAGALGFFVLAKSDVHRAQCLRVLGDIYVRRGETSRARACYMQGLEVAVPLGSRYDTDKLRESLARLGPSDVLADRVVADERRADDRSSDIHPDDEATSPPPG